VAIRPSQGSSVSTRKSLTASSDTATLDTDTRESQYSAMTTVDSQTQDIIPQPMVIDSDARSDASFDPLFDDEPEGTSQSYSALSAESKLAMPGGTQPQHPLPQGPPPPRLTTFIPPPKNAPPLLDPSSYSTYSPELLLTASIDGQVILWDRRVQTSGTGVGRLWMSEKTPPWCLSVRPFLFFSYAVHKSLYVFSGLLVSRWRSNICGT
jgi:transcriptional activator SPT8